MGQVQAIYVAAAAGETLAEVPEARAVAGRGLEGDRYYAGTGEFSKNPGEGREITLIEAEAIEAVTRDYHIDVTPGEPRRNVVTRGVALNHLVGREFTVGDVRLRGVRLCEPCNHLEEHTGKPGFRAAFKHRAGLRAQILNDGVIRKGDPVDRAV